MAALTSRRGLIIIRNPVEAATNSAYQAVAERLVAAEMIVHLRYADTGSISLVNTHPFTQDGRACAHNGVVGNLDAIETRLGSNRAMVMGETDSERFFALITLAIRDAGGDVRSGITAAICEVVERYELYSLNFLLADGRDLWALRYPEHNQLFVLERAPGGPRGDRSLDETSAYGTLRMRSAEGSTRPLVVVASEPMDDDPGWEEVAPGELVHVGPDLRVHRELVLPEAPARQMVLAGLAAESQAQEHV